MYFLFDFHFQIFLTFCFLVHTHCLLMYLKSFWLSQRVWLRFPLYFPWSSSIVFCFIFNLIIFIVSSKLTLLVVCLRQSFPLNSCLHFYIPALLMQKRPHANLNPFIGNKSLWWSLSLIFSHLLHTLLLNHITQCTYQ